MKYRIATLLYLLAALTVGYDIHANVMVSDIGTRANIHTLSEGASFSKGAIDPALQDTLQIPVLFQRSSFRNGLSTLDGVLKDASFLEIDPASLNNWLTTEHAQVSLALPQNSRTEVILDLYEVSLFTEDFKITTDAGDFDMSLFTGARFYKGVVKGHSESLVSFTIWNDQVVGMISYDGLHQVLHKMDREETYILYYTDDLLVSHPFSCGVEDDEVDTRDGEEVEESAGDSKQVNIPCVRVFMECDYALFMDKGGVAPTANWIAAVFNNVASLYEEESILLKLSEIFVWTNKDPYNTKSSITALNQFKTTRKTFNGDIAHLAALGGHSIGGVAWLDVICNSNYRFGYSNIHSSFQSIPVFSWTVEVIAHEIGHNLGSRHTHWCGWQDGPIDNCFTPEGKCPTGPAPTDGGTIMSYCHLSQAGINFNKGFGPQPGDRIRSRVVNAKCLSSCSMPANGICGKPGELEVVNVSHETAILEWQNGLGASDYVVSYKLKENGEWTATDLDTNVFVLTGLEINTWYQVKVQSKCDTTLSAASATVDFRTLNESEYCVSKGKSTLMEWIEHVELANLKRVSGPDNGYADASNLIANMETGKTYTLTFKAGMNRASFNEFWRMWVDYDQNGRFDDNELVFSRISSSSAAMTRAIRIPASAKSGMTKMRIAMKYGAHASACEVFEYGEVEDFTIHVINGANLESDHTASTLELFPNPTIDWLTIRNIQSDSESKGDLTILDMLGKVMWQQSIAEASEAPEININIEHWPNGQYILIRNEDNLNTQHKFLKL